MDAADYARWSRSALEALVEAASGDLAAAVPSCPDWAVRDLLFHAGNAVTFWTQIAQGCAPNATERPVRPDDAVLRAWLTSVVADDLATLAGLDPTLEAWSLTDDRTVGFIQRRIAHELAVHAWDATTATGVPRPVDPEVAVDGIDEFFEVWLAPNPAYRTGVVQSVHLHATDVAGEWLVVVGEGELTVAREHAKGDVAVRATASDLLLLLWGRVTPDGGASGPTSGGAFGGEVFGDTAELDRFLARVAT